MARKKSPVAVLGPSYHEPTPKQECDYAIERAAEKAVLAHPRTQKLRDAIKQRMVKAAGGENGTESPAPAKKRRTTPGK
jgi:hypothetical protein